MPMRDLIAISNEATPQQLRMIGERGQLGIQTSLQREVQRPRDMRPNHPRTSVRQIVCRPLCGSYDRFKDTKMGAEKQYF